MKGGYLVFLLPVVGAAAGFAAGLPDVTPPIQWLCPEPEPPKRGYVGQRLDQFMAIPVQRESSWPTHSQPASKPSVTNNDEEFRVIECTTPPHGYAVEDCDCWIYGNCEHPLTRQSRLTTCELKHGIYDDCACWVLGNPYPDTICRLIYQRELCAKISDRDLDMRVTCDVAATDDIEDWLWIDPEGSRQVPKRPRGVDLQPEFDEEER